MQAQQLTIAVERLNGDIRSITQQISGSESRIAVLENDIARNEESAAALQEEIATGEQDRPEAAAALERHRAVAKSMERPGEACRGAGPRTGNGLPDQREQRQRRPPGHPAAEVADLTAKRTEAQVAKAAAESRRGDGPAAPARREHAESPGGPAGRSKAGSGRYHRVPDDAGGERKAAGKIPGRSGAQAEEPPAALDEADRRTAAGPGTGCRPPAALSVLRELEKNMDGYQNSVKTVMRAASARRCGASSGRCFRS